MPRRLLILLAGLSVATAQPIPASCTEGLPFTMPEVRVPVFAAHTESIRAHGAVADGLTLNTRAISGAIEACAAAGGGTVVIPAGTWLTGPVTLRDSINLHLEQGALLQFSSRLAEYPVVAGLDGNAKRFAITPLINAFRVRNVAITGPGIIDGGGEAWRYTKKEKLTERQWKDLVASGGIISPDGTEWWPSKEAFEGAGYLAKLTKAGTSPTADDVRHVREYLRPDLVRFVQCTDILFDGPTFRNAPRYHLHPVQSENIIIRNVFIQTDWFAQNGDGLDLSACRNVIVDHATLDVGDDGICLKPGAIADRQTPGPACANIVIADCTVYHAHGGFVVGSESFGGVRNIFVRNCVFIGTDVGLRFKSMRGNGGLVENVFIDGIQMRSIMTEAILFDMYYSGNSPEVESQKRRDGATAEPVNERTPRFQNISVKNVFCNGAARAILLNGLPELPIRNITIEHVSITASAGCYIQDADGVTMSDIRLSIPEGPAFLVNNGRNVSLDRVALTRPVETFLSVKGERSAGITLTSCEMGSGELRVTRAPEVNPSAVREH